MPVERLQGGEIEGPKGETRSHQNSDADVTRCNADDEKENDRGLTATDT
jgi:hypothetical protein